VPVRSILTSEQVKAHFQLLKRVNFTAQLQEAWSWEKLAGKLQNNLQAKVILNTRKDTLETLQLLNLPTFESAGSLEEQVHLFLEQSKVLHLSTLLCGAHRRRVLEVVRARLKQKEAIILISTQVVEAGVDVDFPVVYRALGPLDRIVQAAGRCNREGKLEQNGFPILGEVIIFDPGSNPPPGDYKKATDTAKRILQRTDTDLHDPAIFEEYFQSLYQINNMDKNKIQDDRKNQRYKKVAQKFTLIEDDTTSVVIPYYPEIQKLLKVISYRGLRKEDFQKLQPYVVSLRQRDLKQANQNAICQEITPGLWVWDYRSYHPLWGIGLDRQPLAYDPMDLVH